jgi:hypothetical protein
MAYEPENLRRWTMPDHYFGAQWPDYYSSGVGQCRDSDDLEESNFATMLKELGGESDTVIVVRELHWAVGWVEWIAVHESDETALRIADDLNIKLADYPVLDESDWSEREMESANQVWRDCYSWRDRISYMRQHRHQFDFYNYSDILDCIRGTYFAGYANELLN